MAKKSLELPSSKNESVRSFLSGFDGIVKIVRKETLLYRRKSDVTHTLSGLSNLCYILVPVFSIRDYVSPCRVD